MRLVRAITLSNLQEIVSYCTYESPDGEIVAGIDKHALRVQMDSVKISDIDRYNTDWRSVCITPFQGSVRRTTL